MNVFAKVLATPLDRSFGKDNVSTSEWTPLLRNKQTSRVTLSTGMFVLFLIRFRSYAFKFSTCLYQVIYVHDTCRCFRSKVIQSFFMLKLSQNIFFTKNCFIIREDIHWFLLEATCHFSIVNFPFWITVL